MRLASLVPTAAAAAPIPGALTAGAAWHGPIPRRTAATSRAAAPSAGRSGRQAAAAPMSSVAPRRLRVR